VGNMKGVGRIYQQTFVDTYSKVACDKLYAEKTPVTAADLLQIRFIGSVTRVTSQLNSSPSSEMMLLFRWVNVLYLL
jgi:hypothetical protein